MSGILAWNACEYMSTGQYKNEYQMMIKMKIETFNIKGKISFLKQLQPFSCIIVYTRPDAGSYF
jgi:hypothetical protein